MDGKSSYAIGKELSISKNTTRAYRKPQAQARLQIKMPSKLDSFKAEIHLMMSQGIFNCVVMVEQLRDKDYTSGMRILKEYVHPFRPAKSIPAVPRYESLPGKQAQIDWGICNYLDDHGEIHFANFSSDMGFVPKVCRFRRSQTKGKVERLVRYVKNNFLTGRTFTGLGDLNLQTLDWCKKADSKVTGTTRKIPLKELSNEALRPLPKQATRDNDRWEVKTVTKDGFVSCDGARYGIPWQYAGRELRVRICADTFEAYDGEVRIATHSVEIRSLDSYDQLTRVASIG